MDGTKKPRIVIVGAGMAGLSAANRLMEVGRAEDGSTSFDLTVLEGSDRAGGRIYTTEFCGERVETGATWIHGIEGSPIYAIAKQIGALEDKDKPWECMDGYLDVAVVKAEGGLTVAPSIVDPIVKVYKDLLDKVQNQNQKKKKTMMDDLIAEGYEGEDSGGLDVSSLGSYLRDGFETYLCEEYKKDRKNCSPSAVLADLGQLSVNHDGRPSAALDWNLRSLQESIFISQSDLERTITAADSLDDVDLESNKEYWEFPGKHVTIPEGYSSVVQELVNRLPPDTIMYNKKVERIVWCKMDGRPVLLKGPDIEADHVILTVSLGVLKSGTQSEIHGNYDKVDSQGLSFQPPLPSRKVESIDRLGFGVVDKLLLHMGSGTMQHPNIKFVFDQKSDHSNGVVPWWMRKTFSLHPIHKKSNVLVTWLAGKEALKMESLADHEIIKGVVDTLSAFDIRYQSRSTNSDIESDEQKHDDKPVINSILRSRWGKNLLFQGSYSYVPVGSTGEDIDVLAEPLPNSAEKHTVSPLQILFAGEATDRHYYSTTHGAFLSGLREANRLLKHYSFSLP